MRVANIIPATKIFPGRPQVFSYSAENPDLSLEPGMIVEIPFGKRQILGVVESLTDGQKIEYDLKPVTKIVWSEAIFTPELIQLARYLSEYYLVSLGLMVKAVMAKYAPRARDLKISKGVKSQDQAFQLTSEQELAVGSILESRGKAAQYLLHGVTGSGKTEVYLRVMQELIKENKQAMILVPEIALTPQTLQRFTDRFSPEVTAVIHSKISYGQKCLIWKKIHNNEIKILVGPRSAVFAPFQNLGLIVMDEEHDSSYKQTDQNPKFHARTAAIKLSEIWSCPLILGDATPSMETYHAAESRNIKKIELTRRIRHDFPPVDVIDMREESRKGNFSVFSEALTEAVRETLEKKQQLILFLNRRGSATAMMCRDCGEVVSCSRCSVPLVYHQSRGRLVCHHCDRAYDVPAACAKCGSHLLKLVGTGTEKVEDLVKNDFPGARVKRLDRDSILKKGDLENLYQDFTQRRFDILVGTQLLAKGWDLGGVGLIGVVNSDTVLSFPDFKTNERTFQLITQVSGRTGRGEFPGRVILQTYNPDNFALQAAVTHDYKKFYEREIKDRQAYRYPPFTRLIKLTYKHSDQQTAMQNADGIAGQIASLKLPVVETLGPSPAFIPRIRGRYGVYVIIKLNDSFAAIPSQLNKLLCNLPAGWDIDVDPESLL